VKRKGTILWWGLRVGKLKVYSQWSGTGEDRGGGDRVRTCAVREGYGGGSGLRGHQVKVLIASYH